MCGERAVPTCPNLSQPVPTWFIPACAGNARATLGGEVRLPVHPRVCGERIDDQFLLAWKGGSSPRVRGTLLSQHRAGRELRFIPACAGNAPATCAGGFTWPVHPRVCGERRRASRGNCPCRGSSPRVRGTHRKCVVENLVGRFIPACAGNARLADINNRSIPVHPRVCGERAGPGYRA